MNELKKIGYEKKPLYEQMYDLHRAVLNKESGNITLNSAFLPLCRLINSYDPDFIMPDFVDAEVEPLHYIANTTPQLLLFNGDLTSTACAMMYASRPVKLLFFGTSGRIEKLVNMLNMDLITEQIRPILGWNTHKDKSILRGLYRIGKALEYAMDNQYSLSIITGYIDDYGNTAYDRVFRLENSLLREYERIIKLECPEFHIVKPIPNVDIALQQVRCNKAIVSSILDSRIKSSS